MYYAEPIAWASSNGIVTGYDESTFGPNDAITREQMAAILYRYAQYKGYDTAQGGMALREYDDYAEISEYALEAMGWAVSQGLVTGTSSTTLTPDGSAIRAQVATIFQRFHGGRGGSKSKKSDTRTTEGRDESPGPLLFDANPRLCSLHHFRP